MKESFLHIAPYSTFLFVVALPPEVMGNFKNRTYSSGTFSSWFMRILGYTLFGAYSVVIHEYVVGAVQFVALFFSLLIFIQRYIYRHAT